MELSQKMGKENQHIDSEFIDNSWQNMSQLLDKEMPVQKKKRRFLLLWFLGLAVLLTLGGIYFTNQLNAPLDNQKTNKLDSLKVYNNSFLVQEDTLKLGYNQIKGAILYGLFKENELYQVDIDKNTETIYFQRNDKQELVGINKVICSRIKILFEEKQMTDVYYYNNVEGTLFQEQNLAEEARVLPGLNWRGDERIASKKDLFRGEKTPILPKIQGLPLPEEEKDFFDEETLERLSKQNNDLSRFKDVKLESEIETIPQVKKDSLKEEKKTVILESVDELKKIPKKDSSNSVEQKNTTQEETITQKIDKKVSSTKKTKAQKRKERKLNKRQKNN